MKGKIRLKLLYFFPLIFLMACTMLFAACNEQEEKPKSTLYTLVYQAGEGGSVSGESEQKVLEGENGSFIAAVPNEGYEFDKWTDGITTATRMDTNVRSDLTVTAFFQKKTYTVSYKAAENGTLKGETNQTVSHGGSAKSVTAVPNEGYEFAAWSDGITTAIRTDENVQESFSVIATFRKKTYTVRYETDGSGFIQGEANQTIEHGDLQNRLLPCPMKGMNLLLGRTELKPQSERTKMSKKVSLS